MTKQDFLNLVGEFTYCWGNTFFNVSAVCEE